MFPEHVERSFLDPEYSRSSANTPNYIREAKVRPIKNQLYSPNTPNSVREQMFAQLKTGFGLVSGGTSVRGRFGSPLSSKVVVCGHCLVTLSLTINETLKWLSSLPISMQESFSGPQNKSSSYCEELDVVAWKGIYNDIPRALCRSSCSVFITLHHLGLAAWCCLTGCFRVDQRETK